MFSIGAVMGEKMIKSKSGSGEGVMIPETWAVDMGLFYKKKPNPAQAPLNCSISRSHQKKNEWFGLSCVAYVNAPSHQLRCAWVFSLEHHSDEIHQAVFDGIGRLRIVDD